MAIEVPEGVQGLFLVLTGERWPTANEDALREVGNAWGTAGDRLENELGPYLIQAVQHIRANFTGKSAIKFADLMAPYAVDPPHYIPQAAAQFRDLKKFLLNASAQVEYIKIISIEELILLIAQIAWAIAMAFWTSGASMTWIAARMAIVRFLLKTWWGRLILQFVLAELFGIAFQLALDVLTQAIQFAKHTRTEWDVHATISAVEVGAVGGLMTLPFAAISHVVATRLTRVLSRVLGKDVNVAVLQPTVVRAVNGAARNLDNTPIADVAQNITSNLFKAADKPLRVRLVEIGVPAIVHMVTEGLEEAVVEGTVMALNGQGFTFNPFSFTSGAASSAATQVGHGIGMILATPKPVRQGYTSLGDGDEKGQEPLRSGTSSALSDTGTVTGPSDTETVFEFSDTDTVSSFDGGSSTSGTTAVSTAGSTRSSSPALSNGASRDLAQRSDSTSAPASGDPVRNGSSTTNRASSTAPPPVPPKDTVSASSRSETPPPVPPKNGASGTTTASRGNGDSTSSRSVVEGNGNGRAAGSSTAQTSNARSSGSTGGRPAETSSSTSVPSSSGRTGRNEESASPASPRSGGRTAGETTASGAGTGGTKSTSASSTASPSAPSKSTPSTSTPSTSSETSRTGMDQGAARRDGASSTGSLRDRSQSETTTPSSTAGGTKPAGKEGTTEAAAGDKQGGGRGGQNPAGRSSGGPGNPPSRSETKLPDRTGAETGRVRNTNPFRTRADSAETAMAGHTPRAQPNPASPATALPAEVTKDAALVPAGDLAALTSADLPLADRLIVTGQVAPNEVKAAAERLGVDVVAQVDRAQIGNGRRKGVQWMNFPANGGRPRPVATPPGPITAPSWTRTTLDDGAIKSRYPWLPKINPRYAQGGDFLTNCLLAAIGVDSTLEEARLDPTEDPGLLPFYQVPPDGRSPYEHLTNMGKGDPIDVPGYQAIVDAVGAAGRGSRGMVLVGTQGTDIDHVFNVVHDANGIVFLDGQKGVQADLPRSFRSLQFLPTSEGFPRHTVAVSPTPWRHGRFVGDGGTSAEHGGDRTASGRTPFSGPGERLGGTDGLGAAIPGLDNAVREKSAALRAEAEAKAKAEGKDPHAGRRPAAPRRGGPGTGPVTIDDVPLDSTWKEAPQRPEPFGGEGRRLGAGKDAGGIPGLEGKDHRQAEARRAEAREKARKNGEQSVSKSRPRAGGRDGVNDAVTIHDLPKGAGSFPGTGHTLGKGDGKGTGIPGLSNELREESAAERLKRSGGLSQNGKAVPFSGTGHRLGEDDRTTRTTWRRRPVGARRRRSRGFRRRTARRRARTPAVRNGCAGRTRIAGR